jgi:hypothetical protein
MPLGLEEQVDVLSKITADLTQASQAGGFSGFVSEPLIEARRLVREASLRMDFEQCIADILKVFSDFGYDTSSIVKKVDRHAQGRCCDDGMTCIRMGQRISSLSHDVKTMMQDVTGDVAKDDANEILCVVCDFFHTCHYMKSDPSSSWKNSAVGEEISDFTSWLCSIGKELKVLLATIHPITKRKAMDNVLCTYENPSKRPKLSKASGSV